MKIRMFSKNDSGFALLELLLLVVVAVVIAGAAVYVYRHRDDEAPVAQTSTSAVGTVDRTNELNASEVNQEQTIDSGYDAQAETNAVNDSAAMTNLGGASDGSNL